MRVNFEIEKFIKGKNSWGFLVFPSIGVGYCDKFLCFYLYLFAWSFSIDFDWSN